jgi:hypothetical protein
MVISGSEGRGLVWAHFGFFDAAEGGLLRVGEAFGVDAEEDGDAVACPFGDLGGGDACVQPGGQAGVPQVVRTFAEGRCGFGRAEYGLAGLLPGAAVDAIGEQAASLSKE